MTRAARLGRERRRLWRLARLLAHLVAGLVIAHGLLPLLAISGRDRRQHCRQALIRRWHRRLLRILAVRLQIEGEPASGAVLYAANHVSWLDIPCLGAIVNAVFVAKQDVRRWPLVGAMAERLGTIFLARGERDASSRAAERMTWALARTQSVIVFPEGTTTDGRAVGHFHARLFQAAVHAHAAVQAVALSYPHPAGTHPAAPFIGEDDLARHLWRLLAEPSLVVRLVFCPPLSAHHHDRRGLAEHTRAQVLAALGASVDESVNRIEEYDNTMTRR